MKTQDIKLGVIKGLLSDTEEIKCYTEILCTTVC